MTHFTTKSGLQIGVLSKKQPPIYHDADAIKLQRALLGDKPAIDVDGLGIAVFIMAAAAVFVSFAFF